MKIVSERASGTAAYVRRPPIWRSRSGREVRVRWTRDFVDSGKGNNENGKREPVFLYLFAVPFAYFMPSLARDKCFRISERKVKADRLVNKLKNVKNRDEAPENMNKSSLDSK
ncbi:hypothetical protein EVAR_651_1 [Eumeta japonica]|uniref:Uncharacterized protein n=1 Tax=Eumeta variegata TaxID=151549 RepID=A0A4C1SBG8_EUMVA|nr:hypothetical protein EVAR_651_1 [Eumeta japonica]